MHMPGGGLNLVCPRVGVLSLLRSGVLSRRQGFTLPHTHSHMERNPGRQDFTTHTRTLTPHTVTRTHAHYYMHTHTHTQGQSHAHKHIQTYTHTRTQKNTLTLATLPADKARHARQLVGHW